MADHNDPNAVNSIFSDIDVSAADVYDMFGYPSDDRRRRGVVIALTFAVGTRGRRLRHRHALPAPGDDRAAVARPDRDRGLDDLLDYVDAVKDKYLASCGRPRCGCGPTPSGAPRSTSWLPRRQLLGHGRPRQGRRPRRRRRERDRLFLGGRDDAFFNDLPGSSGRSTTRRSSTTCPHGTAGPARAADPEDAARAGGERPLQLRPAEPAPRPAA